MNSAVASSDLDLIKGIVQRSSQRIDSQAFHFVHWGIIVLVWYPLANWLILNGHNSWAIRVGIGSIVLGMLLSTVRSIRTVIHPRIPDCNKHISRQVTFITTANLVAGCVLTAISPSLHFIEGHNIPIVWGLVYANLAFMIGVAFSKEFMISGIAIFLGCIAAIIFQDYNGYILGPAMGFGMIIPGLRAEARVRKLVKSYPNDDDSTDGSA